MHVLTAGPLSSTWLPEHGMVGASLTHDGEELLGQRGGLEAYLEKGSAFGIPLLAPWANRLDGLRYGEVEIDPARVKLDGHGLPKDGVMAGRAWTIGAASDTELRAGFESSPEVLAVFPFPHHFEITVALTPSTLTVTTKLRATGVVPVPVSFGWHPLFTLPGVARAALEVRVPGVRESVLDARGIPGGARDPAFADGPLGARVADAEYPVLDGDFVLAGGGRELRVRFGADTGYPVGHVWAPEGEAFVAWEPMTAPTNALVTRDGLRHLAPGRSFAATFTVEVASLPAGARS